VAINRTIDLLINGSPRDPDAQWKAAIKLGSVASSPEKSQAARALRDVLISGRAHALTRAHAVESLGRLRLRSSTPVVLQALTDSYRLVRSYAVGALGAIKNPRAVDPLLAALRGDRFFGVRAEAAKALGELAANTRDIQLRNRILRALTQARRMEESKQLQGKERVLAELDRSIDGLSGRVTRT
jgi:HEAT repeat protein